MILGEPMPKVYNAWCRQCRPYQLDPSKIPTMNSNSRMWQCQYSACRYGSNTHTMDSKTEKSCSFNIWLCNINFLCGLCICRHIKRYSTQNMSKPLQSLGPQFNNSPSSRYAFWFWPFWKSGWNVFDFVVVTIGIMNMSKMLGRSGGPQAYTSWWALCADLGLVSTCFTSMCKHISII